MPRIDSDLLNTGGAQHVCPLIAPQFGSCDFCPCRAAVQVNRRSGVTKSAPLQWWLLHWCFIMVLLRTSNVINWSEGGREGGSSSKKCLLRRLDFAAVSGFVRPSSLVLITALVPLARRPKKNHHHHHQRTTRSLDDWIPARGWRVIGMFLHV